MAVKNVNFLVDNLKILRGGGGGEGSFWEVPDEI